jgi:cbb3-type cytochrome oxidase cytochrome c subunit
VTGDLLPVTLDDMISEVSRECRMRREVYSRAARERRMNRRMADRRIDVMDAILVYLQRLKAEGRDAT